MKLPTVALVVFDDNTTVQLHCAASAVVLNVPSGLPVAHLAQGAAADVQLPIGVYHVACSLGVRCKVLRGDCSVVVVNGGDDPWPTPPPKPFKTDFDFEQLVSPYFRAL